MKSIKQAGALLLSFLMIFALYFGGSDGKSIHKGHSVYAEGKTVATGMSKIRDQFPIGKLNRPSGEGLWKIMAGGKTAFCLNSGKSMCSGDVLKYKSHNAVTFEKQGIARALTYYYKNSSKSDKSFALIQAYIWSCGKGVSKIDTVYQAGKNMDKNYSSADAKRFCEQISNTDPEGTIYYYSVTHCVRGKKHETHQMLYSLTPDETVKPKYETLTVSDKKKGIENLKVKIRKRDLLTSTVLSGAEFKFYCDGKSVGTAVTGDDGTAVLSYIRNMETSRQSVQKKYIKNWKELTKSQQKKETSNGYYASKAKAKSAADKELEEKLNHEFNTLKKKGHSWEAEEIKAPWHHKRNEKVVKKIETGTTTMIEFGDFYNDYLTVKLEISKKSVIEDFGTDATYANAEYGVYADEDIMKTDNKSIWYKKDEKVTKIITNESGYGCAKDLPQGKYYLKEEDPPQGFQKNEEVTKVTLDQDKKIIVYDTPYTGKLRIHKTYGQNKKNEEKAVFEVYNSKRELVDCITTANDGTAMTKELPYGSYTLHQIKGMDGFSKIPDITKEIDGSMKTYQIEMNNPSEAARITITKTISLKNTQGELIQKRPEEEAKFEIIRKTDRQVMEVLTTDENGYAASKRLEPGVYTVHQIKGRENYKVTDDFDVILKDGDSTQHSYTMDDPWDGKRLMLKKTTQKNKKEKPESAAEFIVLDAAKAKSYDKTDLQDEQSRKKYIDSLTKDAVIGKLITDADGTAEMMLEKLKEDGEFIVIQTKGMSGYDLAPVYDSRQHEPENINGMKVYEFRAKDIYSDQTTIEIEKEKKISDTDSIAESGAEFQLIDLNGDIVATMTTGKDGKASAEEIALGTYILRQTKGSQKHELLEDQRIILSSQDKGKTVKYTYKNKEKPVDFILEKHSEETKKLLNGAVYGIYDDDGKEAAVLKTGSMKDGYATCKLSYGHYTIREILAPDGYNKNESKKEFTLNLESVNYDGEGNGIYEYHDSNEPVYGVITLKKTGDVLTGYDTGFVYENDLISGAVYGLYAKEDIKKDDNSIAWKKGSLIDQKTTTKDGSVKFTRKDSKGKETDKFYQGVYYIKEIYGPYGYCIDNEEYEVIINWDTKPGDLNKTDKNEEISDTEGSHGNNSPYPDNGIYVLETGDVLNERIKDAKSVTFTWEMAPSGKETIDVSQNKDGSIRAWKEGTDYYISSQKEQQVIYMNAVSADMFAGCSSLEHIYFKNIDTSRAKDMSEMFYECSNLEELDLTGFNMSNVENVQRMFYGCKELKTTYVKDQYIQTKDDYKDEKMTRISAAPKTEFVISDSYKAEDFTFTAYYDDDGMQEINDITDNDISFEPKSADYAGNRKVKIIFKDSGRYKGYDPIETTVQVVDPSQTDVSLKTDRQINIGLEFKDVLQKYSIHLIKKDEKGKLLKGAVFALKAACTIIDHNGKIIFKKGDTITTGVSQNDQFGYLEFFGLPTDLYAEDVQDDIMYKVEEISAPDGYLKDNESLEFSGNTKKNKTENIVHDVSEEGNENDDKTTYIHDSKVIENLTTTEDDPIFGKITLKKKDPNGRDLENVIFTLETSDGKEIASSKTNAKGEIKFEHLLPDSYVIRETKTIQGYSLLKEPIHIKIPLVLTKKEAEDKKADISKAIQRGNKYYFYDLTYEIANDTTWKLPITGSKKYELNHLLAVCGMGFILCGIMIYYRKKKNN